MLESDLNELKQYKAITLYEQGYKISNNGDCYPDIYYFCGFIEDIYIKDEKLILRVYGLGFPLIWEFRHKELKIEVEKINNYEKKYEETNYEYMTINTSFEDEDDKSRYFSHTEYKLFKYIDFEFLVGQFAEVGYESYQIENAILTDEYALKLLEKEISDYDNLDYADNINYEYLDSQDLYFDYFDDEDY
ncbi:MAG: hypothetical protein V8S33_03645 [Intestinibacter bartlettii]